MPFLYIVDDEPSVCWAFETFFQSEGHRTRSFGRAEEAIAAAAADAPDAILLDLRLPGMDGLQAIGKFREATPRSKILLITAHGTTAAAIEAVKRGAYDFLHKPIEPEAARIALDRALEAGRLAKEVVRLKQSSEPPEALVGKSPAMQSLYKRIGGFAESDVSVLIRGESGTGKEFVAQTIHGHSARADRPFEPIHCAAVPETLLEAEMFGHEKGAYTGASTARPGRFELADGGTIFLDEVGDIPASIQVKLLRFLETHEVERLGGREKKILDVRILSATNQDLESRMSQGAFREDLYYRLNGATLEVPPLRDRGDDLPLLVEHFLRRSGSAAAVSRAAMESLQRYPWPGNVRELKHAVEHAAVLSRGQALLPEHLPEGVLAGGGPGRGGIDAALDRIASALFESAPHGRALEALMDRFERPILRRALERTDWNQLRAAEILGIHRTTLKKRMSDLGLSPPGTP